LHRDWLGILAFGIEAPGLHRFDRLFIKPHSERSHDPNVMGFAIGSDDHIKDDRSLILGAASFLGILRIRGIDRARGADSATDFVKAAANTASLSWSNSRAMTGADA